LTTHVAQSLIDSGATTLIENFGADALKTTTVFLGIMIPSTLAIWGAKVPILKGVAWLKSSVFKRN
jgi:hypothetical protein